MKTSQLLDWLVDTLASKPEAQWMKSGKHEDIGWRNVIVKPSGFIIEIPHAYERRDESSYAAINFESAGYKRLSAHQNQHGTVDIPLSRMCYLYAIALQSRLQAVLKDCEFSRVSIDRDTSNFSDSNFLFVMELLSENGKYAKFSYRVPVEEGSNLF